MSEYRFQQPANEDSKLVPFGKYKGQPIESMLADRDYLDWVIAQPGIVAMLQVKFPALFNIITIGAPTTDDSPEHNKLQAKFLNKAFQYAFIELLTGKSVQWHLENEISRINTETLREWEEKRDKLKAEREWREKQYSHDFHYVKAAVQAEKEHLESPPKSILNFPVEIELNFECGFDVGLGLRSIGRLRGPLYQWAIEIKPTLGDNFPSVLRQIKRNGATVVVIGKFQSVACTFEEVQAMFAVAGAKIVTIEQIEQIKA